jgi:amidase
MREPDYDLGGTAAADRAWRDLRLTVVANFLGLPALALPTGLGGDGMPTGVQLIGPMFGEDVVFAAAHDVESRVGRMPLPAAAPGPLG